MIPAEVITTIEERLSEGSETKILIKHYTPVTGGCINFCFLLEASSGVFFLKYNDAAAFPNMFKAETAGLKLRSATRVGCGSASAAFASAIRER